jgi:hypothetical protein
MDRKTEPLTWDDFEDWKLVRGANEETHQIEFALK